MKKVLLIIAIVTITNALFAQETFTEALNLSEKKLSKHFVVDWRTEKEWNPDTKYGTGPIPDLSRVDLKKIALVTYTIYAPDTYEKFVKTQLLTEKGINYFANKLYDKGIGEIKKTFKESGIELFTLEDMTDEQKRILADASGSTWLDKLDDKNNKLSDRYKKVEEKGVKVGTTVDGYKNWTIARHVVPPWTTKLITKLADALDVDAVLLISNRLAPVQKGVFYSNTTISMIGRNPIPKVGKGPGYTYGQLYSQITFECGSIQLAKMKKGNLLSENYEDFDVVMGMLTKKMLESIETNTRRSQEIYDKKHK